ncbi:hypothetical protein Tco_0475688 [Tanacetum coccineum]
MVSMMLRLVFSPWRGVTDWYQSQIIENYVSLIREKFCWETIFPIGLKPYRDPKEEPIEKEPLMELKEIELLIACRMFVAGLDPRSRVTLAKANLEAL